MLGELPSNYAEIKNRQGFPSTKTEGDLLLNFFVHCHRPALELAKRQVPAWQPTENQTELYLAFLYGIYFYNLVAGGAILAGFTSCNNDANDYRRLFLQQQPPPTPRSLPLPALDFSSWPLHLTHKKGPPFVYDHGIIVLPVRHLPDIDPHRPLTYSNIAARYLFPPSRSNKFRIKTPPLPAYTCDPFHGSILTGIEEAQHTHFNYLERIHYGARFIQESPRGPLKSLRSELLIALDLYFKTEGAIEYDALLGCEFAAHLVQAEYVRRYLPNVWQNGYQDYHQAIVAYRRQERRKQQKHA